MKRTKERIYPTQIEITQSLDMLRHLDHIQRYQIIKRYCFGKVLDAACGVGYGSWLLSNNPYIKKIIGIDISNETIEYANINFKNDKTEFVCKSLSEFDEHADTLVSIETIEHIKDKQVYLDFVNRVDPKILIISFPNKESTHFNEFHFHDYSLQDVVKMFSNYLLATKIISNDVTIVVFAKIDNTIPTKIFSDVI